MEKQEYAKLDLTNFNNTVSSIKNYYINYASTLACSLQADGEEIDLLLDSINILSEESLDYSSTIHTISSLNDFYPEE